MVSPLWKACADGDVNNVDDLLKDATSVDIEIKDHTGVTPLIQAVKGGHVHVVKVLLARGADPTNASAQGRPESYTSDPHILQILASARGEHPIPYPDPAQAHYYPYPQYQYPYPDPSAGYYPPPQQQQQQMPQEGEHAGNLPPPEVARNIPCRYFPACRYGSACVFAHPQAPYFPGPLPPPALYGPPHSNPPPPPQHFDPNMPPPPGPYPYYPVSPPFNPVSPAAGHIRSHSDVLSPPPFSPTHLPLPMQYMPPPPLPPPQMSPPYPPLPPPPSAYPRRTSVTSLASYPSPVALDPTHGPPVPKSPEAHSHGPVRPRRGSAGFREGRPLYGGRKPPCLFYPSGKCRNGDECRFPHVMPDGGGVPQPPPHPRHHFPPRSRAGPGYYGSRDAGGTGSGYGTIEEQLAGLSVRDDATPRDATPRDSGGTTTPSSASTKQVSASAAAHINGKNAIQRTQPVQRVPSADDFPVLRGTTPPHVQANGHTLGNTQPGAQGNGHAHPHANGWVNAVNGTGPTAAQLLREKDAAGSRGPSPRPLKDAKPQPNGSAPENLASTGKPTEVQVSA